MVGARGVGSLGLGGEVETRREMALPTSSTLGFILAISIFLWILA